MYTKPGGGKASAGQGVALGASTALLYAFIAVASNFVTKLAGIMLPGTPDVVLTVQLGTMELVMQLAKSLGFVDWAPTNALRLKAFLPLSLAYGAHAALVLRALAILNVPIYNTIKRLTPVMVLCAKIMIDKKLPGLGITGSVVLTVAGCLVAGLGDLTFDLKSYTLAFTAAALQATYILIAEYTSASTSSTPPPRIISLTQFTPVNNPTSSGGLGAATFADIGPDGPQETHSLLPYNKQARAESSSGLIELPRVNSLAASMSPALKSALSVAAESMHCAALTWMPISAVMALSSGQFQLAKAALHKVTVKSGGLATSGWMLVIASIEWLLTGSLILCTQTNSALTTTVVGVLKGILAVMLGFVLLGGVGPQGMSWVGIAGITMNCAGGVWYAWVKFKENSSATKKPATS